MTRGSGMLVSGSAAILKGALFSPLPGSGKVPTSSVEALAATTHPVGGFKVQSGTGEKVLSGTRRFRVAAWIPAPEQMSKTLPVKLTVPRLTTASGVVVSSVLLLPALTLRLL